MCVCVCVCAGMCVRACVCVNASTCFQSLGECPQHGAVIQKLLCDDLIPSLSAGLS